MKKWCRCFSKSFPFGLQGNLDKLAHQVKTKCGNSPNHTFKFFISLLYSEFNFSFHEGPQLWKKQQIPLVNMHYRKRATLREQNLSKKSQLSLDPALSHYWTCQSCVNLQSIWPGKTEQIFFWGRNLPLLCCEMVGGAVSGYLFLTADILMFI